jgi:hypothetical protein
MARKSKRRASAIAAASNEECARSAPVQGDPVKDQCKGKVKDRGKLAKARSEDTSKAKARIGSVKESNAVESNKKKQQQQQQVDKVASNNFSSKYNQKNDKSEKKKKETASPQTTSSDFSIDSELFSYSPLQDSRYMHDRRRADREVHSYRSMKLSRHTSMRMTRDSSPPFSPLHACRLSLSGEKANILYIRKDA